MHGGLKEVGIPHRFVYGGYDDPQALERIMSYCRASHEKNILNMSTAGVFGGRGMGQTCGAADPSQWLKVFGVDIDSRDTTDLLEIARQITLDELLAARKEIQPLFSVPIPEGRDGGPVHPPIPGDPKRDCQRGMGFLYHTVLSRPG